MVTQKPSHLIDAQYFLIYGHEKLISLTFWYSFVVDVH